MYLESNVFNYLTSLIFDKHSLSVEPDTDPFPVISSTEVTEQMETFPVGEGENPLLRGWGCLSELLK